MNSFKGKKRKINEIIGNHDYLQNSNTKRILTNENKNIIKPSTKKKSLKKQNSLNFNEKEIV